jgi:PAS domain-containing protein
MLTLTPTAAALIALVCGGWLAAAVWATLRGLGRSREALGQVDEVARTQALLAASPAIPVLVRRDLGLQATERAAFALGLTDGPADLTADLGLEPDDAARLRDAVREAQATGAAFALTARPVGGARALELRGGPAPPALGEGSVLFWIVDVTDIAGLRQAAEARADRVAAALDALSGLIEAAPFPMWHRGPDLALAMVNSAYVDAVEADDAAAVVAGGVELIDEPGDGARFHAAAARDSGAPHVRTVPATIAGERRTMQVVEVPLGEAGVAGYALDVEDREQARAELARFVRAQRDMLDRLSAGVAQFARDRSLIFFNQPFARMFGLPADFLADRPEFNRLLDAMRDAGHLPEVRDYPDWKKEHGRWFTGGLAAEEEDWNLPKGQHLRVVAQPLPDGGLLLIFEDRTEQLRLASARDTLLRVRTATFDNLFEAIGVFASDGRLHLWNNRFRALWGFEEEQLAAHPRSDSRTRNMPGWCASWSAARRSSASSGPAASLSSTGGSSSSPPCRSPTATPSSPCST